MYIAVSDWNNGPVEDAPNNALRYDEAIVEFHRLLGNQPLVADEIREANSLQSGTPQLRSAVAPFVWTGFSGFKWKDCSVVVVAVGM